MILRNHRSEYGKFYDIELAPFAIKNLMLKVDVVYSFIHFQLLLDLDQNSLHWLRDYFSLSADKPSPQRDFFILSASRNKFL